MVQRNSASIVPAPIAWTVAVLSSSGLFLAVYLLDEIAGLASSGGEVAQGMADATIRRLGHRSPVVKLKVGNVDKLRPLCSVWDACHGLFSSSGCALPTFACTENNKNCSAKAAKAASSSLSYLFFISMHCWVLLTSAEAQHGPAGPEADQAC